MPLDHDTRSRREERRHGDVPGKEHRPPTSSTEKKWTRLQARKALERDLRKALANGELDVFYEPQIDSRRSVIVGAEALVRWPIRDRGMISPAEFVPIAEESA